jgi:hypothetical protein
MPKQIERLVIVRKDSLSLRRYRRYSFAIFASLAPSRETNISKHLPNTK